MRVPYSTMFPVTFLQSSLRAGSRVHIYSFTKSAGQLDLDEDTFEQLKPGLSAYQDEPEKAAESLQPLMQKALDTVPTELQVNNSPFPPSLFSISP